MPDRRAIASRAAISIALLLCLMAAASLASSQNLETASPEVFVSSGSAGMSNLIFSFDGSLVAGGSFDNTVKVFDVRANIELRKFTGHQGRITGVAILPDNDTILSGSADGTIRKWSLAQGAEIGSISVGGPVASMALSSDGRLLVVAAHVADNNGKDDFHVRRWDVRRSEWLPPLKGHVTNVQSVAVSRDGKVIATGDVGSTIKVWNGETGAELLTIKTDKGFIQSLAFNSEATLLAGGIGFNPPRSIFTDESEPPKPSSPEGEARVWSLPTGELKRTFRIAVVDQVIVALHPKEPKLAMARQLTGFFQAGEGRTGHHVQMWNIDTGEDLRLDYLDAASGLAFNPDGKTIVVAARFSTKTLNLTTGRVVREFSGFTRSSFSLAYLRDDRLLIDSSKRKNIIDLQKDILIEKSPCHEPYYFGRDADPLEGRSYTTCSPDERILARIPSGESAVEVVEADSGRVLHRFSGDAQSMTFIDQGRTLAIWTRTGIEIRDVASGEVRIRFDVAKSKFNWNWQFSPRGRYLLTNNHSESDQADNLHVYDTSTGRQLYVKKNFGMVGRMDGIYAPDDQYFAIRLMDKVSVYEMNTGREIFSLPVTANLGAIAFSPDGKIIVASGNNLRWWNRETRAEMSVLTGHTGEVTKVKFSPDGKYLVTGSEDRSIKFWDLKTGTPQKTLTGHTAAVIDFVFSPDGTRLASSGADARTILWQLAESKPVVTFFRTSEGELISITPDNYYHAPPSALSSIALRLGRRVVPLSQLDLKLNRPDIVLERLGSTDSKLIALYRNAYQRRLRRMGFSENHLGSDQALPEVTIIEPVNIPATTRDSKLTLRVRIDDARHKLATFNVLLNDVPVFGRKGIDLKPKGLRTHEQTVTLDLSNGRNRIEVFATNELGVESFRETVEMEYAATVAVKPDLYIAVVGVSEYKTEAYKLKYAAKDAANVLTALQASNQTAFNKIHVREFLDARAHRENILSLREFFRESTVNDEIVLFVSGHGLLEDNAQYYFATVDIDFLKPEKRGISYDELEGILDGVPARRKLLLLDTCHAGEVDPESVVFTKPQSAQNSTATTDTGNVVIFAPKDIRLRAIKIDETAEFLKQTFADLRRGTGTAVIGAAGAAAFAFESEKWKNGVFTFSVLSGLKTGLADLNRDGETTTSELQQFVGGEVARLTKGAQRPVARQELDAFDFALSHNPQLLRKLPHNGSGVHAVAWSPAGDRIATSANDGAIRIWRSNSGELERLIPSRANFSSTVRWTADGKTVVADVWKDINFYDVTSAELRRTIKTENTYLSDFVLSADEQSIVANGDAFALTKYQTSSGVLTKTFEKQKSQVRHVALSGDGSLMASGEDNGSIYIWDLTNDKLVHMNAGAHQRNVTGLQFYRDNGAWRLVSSGAEGTLRFWNPLTGEALQTIKTDQGSKDSVLCLAFSRDAARFATGHADGAIRLWRTADRALIETIFAHREAVRGLSFNPDGQILVSTGGDTSRLWQVRK